jgi:sialic acid synthase SpsE
VRDVYEAWFLDFPGHAVVQKLSALVRHNCRSLDDILSLFEQMGSARERYQLYDLEADPFEQNNLFRLGALRARFPGYRFGFMDHTEGNQEEAMTLPLLALPLGVCCIEKHISLDRTLQLEDYVSALSAERFQAFVQSVRRHERALGTDRLELTETERAYRQKAVKAVVAHRALKQGRVLSAQDICLKRSSRADGTAFHVLEDVVGRTVRVDVESNQPLTKEMIT